MKGTQCFCKIKEVCLHLLKDINLRNQTWMSDIFSISNFFNTYMQRKNAVFFLVAYKFEGKERLELVE
jgi:hypothetical protein